VPRKSKRKAPPDPILAAKTIAQLAKALNDAYQLGWPVRFPARSVLLNRLWQLGIQVVQGEQPRLYKADSTSAFELNDVLRGRVFIDINQPQKAFPKKQTVRKENKNGQSKRKRSARKGSR
jgi:hypothetical protein